MIFSFGWLLNVDKSRVQSINIESISIYMYIVRKKRNKNAHIILQALFYPKIRVCDACLL